MINGFNISTKIGDCFAKYKYCCRKKTEDVQVFAVCAKIRHKRIFSNNFRLCRFLAYHRCYFASELSNTNKIIDV